MLFSNHKEILQLNGYDTIWKPTLLHQIWNSGGEHEGILALGYRTSSRDPAWLPPPRPSSSPPHILQTTLAQPKSTNYTSYQQKNSASWWSLKSWTTRESNFCKPISSQKMTNNYLPRKISLFILEERTLKGGRTLNTSHRWPRI